MSKQRLPLVPILAASLVLLITVVVFGRVQGVFDSREGTLEQLTFDLFKQKQTLQRRAEARSRMDAYEQRSLPQGRQNQQIGRSLYQGWLSGLVEKAQFVDPKLTAPTQRTRNKNYQKLRFTLKTRGTLAQLTEFLHDFYHADHLHQIRKLQITPVADSRDLDIDLVVEALILPEAKHPGRLNNRPSTRLLLGDLSEYQRIIITRNLFGPPNLSPVLGSIAEQTTKADRAVSFTARAKDGDKDDLLTYSLGPDSVKGAAIDPKSGLFRWTPSPVQGPGEYKARIVVTDSGFPPQSDRGEVTIKVVPFQLKLASISDKSAQPGRELSFTVPLSESDPSAKVQYTLGENSPPGASLDRSTGQFRWTPGSDDNASSVTISVHVADDSSSKRHDQATFKIAVASAKPQSLQPDFVAQNTFLTAIVQADGEPEAWLVIRPRGITLRVRTKQTFTAGNLSATVVRITSGGIVLKISDQMISIATGKSFADAEPVPDGRL